MGACFQMVPLPLAQQLPAGPGPGGLSTSQPPLFAEKGNILGCLSITLENLFFKGIFFLMFLIWGSKCHGMFSDVRGQRVDTYSLLLPCAAELSPSVLVTSTSTH